MLKQIIAPSVLNANFLELGNGLKAIENGGAARPLKTEAQASFIWTSWMGTLSQTSALARAFLPVSRRAPSSRSIVI